MLKSDAFEKKESKISSADIDINGTAATSITFTSGASAYAGLDYYFEPISFNFKKWRFN